MQFLSDLLLAAAAIGAAAYCVILSRRLTSLASLEGGLGSAIAILSRQVDDLARSLTAAQDAAARSSGTLDGQTQRAETVARRLELLVAAMHDLPDAVPPPPPDTARSPSPWPVEAKPRTPSPAGASDPAQRSRVLRRRHGSIGEGDL